MSTQHEGLIIYGAGPIDLGQDVPNWRTTLMEEFNSLGCDAVMFDPSTAYKLSRFGTVADRRDAYIENINRNALDIADVMVVVLPNGVMTVGTPIELDFAKAGGVETYLITDIPRGKSVYLNNRIDDEHWIYVKEIRDNMAMVMALGRVAAKISATTNKQKE